MKIKEMIKRRSPGDLIESEQGHLILIYSDYNNERSMWYKKGLILGRSGGAWDEAITEHSHLNNLDGKVVRKGYLVTIRKYKVELLDKKKLKKMAK